MHRRLATAMTLGLLTAACSTASTAPSTAAPDVTVRPDAVTALAERHGTMYRSPLCACCHEYEAILRENGWTVDVVEVDDTAAFKTDNGIPGDAWSCHTLVVDVYVVEGHVPLAAVDRLLERRPAIDGIALPGMPPGSPGMDGVAAGPFEVLAVQSGSLAPFGSF